MYVTPWGGGDWKEKENVTNIHNYVCFRKLFLVPENTTKGCCSRSSKLALNDDVPETVVRAHSNAAASRSNKPLWGAAKILKGIGTRAGILTWVVVTVVLARLGDTHHF